MDTGDRPRHRCVQIKKEGAEEPLSPPHRKNVWWQIKEPPFCSNSAHFTSSVNNLGGFYLDWPAVCSWQEAKSQYPKQNKKLKLFDGLVVTLFYLCCFLFRQFSILIVKDLHSHWNNTLHSYWSLVAPSSLYCCPIVSCEQVVSWLFPRPHWIYDCRRGCARSRWSGCFCAFSLQSLFYYRLGIRLTVCPFVTQMATVPF